MYKKCLENYIAHQVVYKCYVCPRKLKRDFEFVSKHMASDYHKESLEKIDKDKRKNQSDKLLALSESQLKLIVKNSITFDRCHLDSFYCYNCKITISELCNIFEHIKDISHQIASKKYLAEPQIATMYRKKIKISDLELQSKSNCIIFDQKNFPDLVKSTTSSPKSDSIIYDKKCNSYYCTICKCKFVSTSSNSENTQKCFCQAASGAPNILEIKEMKSSSQRFANQIINQSQSTLQNTEVESSKKVLQGKYLRSCNSQIYCCVTCQVFLEDSTDIQCHVMIHLFKEFQLLNNFDILEVKHRTDKKFYLKCLVCDYDCHLKMLDAHEFLKEHFKTKKHLERLTFFKFIKNDLGLEDMDEQINSLDLKKFTYSTAHNICMLNHPSSEHALKKCCEKQLQEVQSDGIISEKKTGFDSNDLHYYKCFMCNISFDNVLKLLEHFKTPAHKWKIEALRINEKCLYINFIRLSDVELITCSLCNIYFKEFCSIIGHIQGKKHNQKFTFVSIDQGKQKNLIINSKKIEKEIKFEAITDEELNQLGFNTENRQSVPLLQSVMANNILDNLVSLNFKKRQTKKLPSHAKTKVSHTPIVQDQKTSFVTNVMQKGGKTFVKFCINSGHENIFNLNNESINLMKLGTTLTFPHYSDRVCIPCGQRFPNDVQSLFEHLQGQEHLKNICDIQVHDKELEKFPEKFNNLRLAKLYMHLSNKSIQCYACNIEIENDDGIIKQHVKNSIHEKKTKLWKEESEQLLKQYLSIYKDIWYYAEVFFCEICKTRYGFEIDFAMHLIHPEHMKKVYELKHKGTSLKFDLCPPCTTYWFGKTDSYEAHCENDFHKLLVNKKDFMVPNLTITTSEYFDDIDIKIDLLVSESDKVNLNKDKVTELLEAIVKAVKPTYPKARAYVFGSRLSYLGFPDSDVDVFLDCENVYYRSSTKEQSQEYIKSVDSYFESTPNTWVVDEVLLATRVPIMKLRHIPTNLKCDISFANGLTVEKSQLVGIYNRAFPICRKLILFMKKWLTLCRIFGSDYITTFAISWCVIFYLQLQGILPTVCELIKRKMESKIVDGWECGFEEIITAKSSSFSLKEHLKGFFTYFANFDYQRNVISPFLGKTIDKHMFAYTDELPPEMDIYKKRLLDNEVDIFRFDSPMCVQDPIDHSQNLTKAFKKRHLRCFRQYCTLSAEKC